MKRWQNYLRDIVSPDSYIRWGFYSLIAANLQRRVWEGTMEDPLHFNLFNILVGEPGTGKDRVINQVRNALSYHKRKNQEPIKGRPDEAIIEGNIIPLGVNATTFQAIISALCRASRAHTYLVEDRKKIYTHSSLVFCLSELASLLRDDTKELVRFLHETYDCTREYTYETISRGPETIKHCCVNLLAGTTPDFLKEIFKDGLINEGFASRAVFTVESTPRFYTMKGMRWDSDQLRGYSEILEHTKKLTTLFGEVKFTDEAVEYMESWINDRDAVETNKSPLLKWYYSRKGPTVKKLAGIIHFSDHTTMEVGLHEVLEAIKQLNAIEPNMHGAVISGVINPLANVTEAIVQYLRAQGPQKKIDLWQQFYSQLPDGESSIDKIILYLGRIGKITNEDGRIKLI